MIAPVFSKGNKVTISALMLVVLILCLLRLDNYYLGFDERATVSCAYGFHFGYDKGVQYFKQDFFQEYYTIKGVVKATMADNGNVFAFNTILHFWSKLAGFDLLFLHLPSILFFVFSIPFFAYLLRKTITQEYTFNIALLIYSFQPFFIYMSRQIRGYSLSLFLTVASTAMLIYLTENSKKKSTNLILIPYIICISLLPLTHYLFGSLMFAHLFFILYKNYTKEIERKIVYQIIVALFFFVIILCSWLFIGGWEAYHTVLKFQVKSWQDHPASFIPINLFNFGSFFSNLICFSEGIILQFLGFKIRTYAILSLPILLLIYIGYFKKNIQSKYLELLWIAPLGMIVSDFILAFRSGILVPFTPKYNIIIMPFMILVFSAGLGYLKDRYKPLTYIGIGFLFSLYSWTYIELIYNDKFHINGAQIVEPRQENPYSKLTIAYENNFQAGDTLVFPAWEKAAFTNYSIKKIDAIQCVNNLEDDKVFLKNNNRYILLFDFSKDWARYNYQWN